jgi:transcription termination/antitermination protein NusA
MNIDIVEAISQISKERNIKREALSEIIQSIFLSMIKRKYDTSDNFEIFVNMDKGEVEIYQTKKIVEEVADPVTEIQVDKAKEVEPDLELGDDFVDIVDPSTFGRRLITSAKQTLMQKIREAEKEVLFNEFKDRIGEVIVGEVRQINREEILISVDHMEVNLPRSEQIHNERLHRGDTVRAVIKVVEQTSRGPEVVVSRTDPKFLIRLFEIEVPEIYDGVIEIKGVARFPGERAKVAVYSNDKRIDAVGACVGLKGVRIQAVVKELNNEKIDVINWSSEPAIFINRSLSPAKPAKVIVDDENKKVEAVIPDDQISLAIGKGGQNRQLASMLTGYEITTVKQSEWEMAQIKEDRMPLSQISGLSKTTIEKLAAAGYENAEDVLEAGKETLMQLKGFGEKTVEKLFESLDGFGRENPAVQAEAAGSGPAGPEAPETQQATPESVQAEKSQTPEAKAESEGTDLNSNGSGETP